MSDRMIRGALTGVVSALGLIGLLQSASADALGTRWRATTLDLASCLNRGEEMLSERGFDIKSAGNDVVVGQIDSTIGQVMCPNGRGLAVFIFMGPDPDSVTDLLNHFNANF